MSNEREALLDELARRHSHCEKLAEQIAALGLDEEEVEEEVTEEE